MMETLYFTLLELLPIQHKLFKPQLLPVLCREWSCISQLWPIISANSHWLSRMMHRYSWEMFWVTFKPFLPSEVRSCNLSNMWEQKEINNSSSHLHTNPHYPFGKGSGGELQTSVKRNKHKERRTLVLLPSLVPELRWDSVPLIPFKHLSSTPGLGRTCCVYFQFCSKCNISAKCPVYYFTLQQNKTLLSTGEYHRAQFFIAWISIFKVFPPKQMLLFCQRLITSLTLECVSLNDFSERCSRKSGAGDSFPYLNFIILGEGGIPCFTAEITFEPQREGFLHERMKSHNFFCFLKLMQNYHHSQSNSAASPWECPWKYRRESWELL